MAPDVVRGSSYQQMVQEQPKKNCHSRNSDSSVRSSAFADLPCQLWGTYQSYVCAAQLQHLEQIDLCQRIHYVCQSVESNFSSSVCLFQPWLSLEAHTLGNCSADSGDWQQLFATPSLGADSEPCFKEFRRRSCLTPLSHKNSMPGRVWRTGALQIVQSLLIIPQPIHPRSNLHDEDLSKVAEVLYIPVYDSLRPTKGAVAVLEVFLSSTSGQSMLIADLISFVSSALLAVNLSLSNPEPPPICKSTLNGRRARARSDSSEGASSEEDSEEEGDEEEGVEEQGAVELSASPSASKHGGGSRGKQAGGSEGAACGSPSPAQDTSAEQQADASGSTSSFAPSGSGAAAADRSGAVDAGKRKACHLGGSGGCRQQENGVSPSAAEEDEGDAERPPKVRKTPSLKRRKSVHSLPFLQPMTRSPAFPR